MKKKIGLMIVFLIIFALCSLIIFGIVSLINWSKEQSLQPILDEALGNMQYHSCQLGCAYYQEINCVKIIKDNDIRDINESYEACDIGILENCYSHCGGLKNETKP